MKIHECLKANKEAAFKRLPGKKIIRHFVLDVNATQTAGLLGMSRLTINRYYREFRELIAPQREADKRLLRGEVASPG